MFCNMECKQTLYVTPYDFWIPTDTWGQPHHAYFLATMATKTTLTTCQYLKEYKPFHPCTQLPHILSIYAKWDLVVL